MSIISSNPTMTFTMSNSKVDMNAKFWNIPSPSEYFTITPDGAVSGTPALKALPAGSVDLVIPYTIDNITVTSIDAYGFQEYTSLSSVAIPDNAEIISYQAFWNCTSLKSIKISEGVLAIYALAFGTCTSLTSAIIPDSVTFIESGFYGCNKLVSINIPAGVTKMDADMFTECTALTSINIDKPKDSITGSPWGCPNVDAIKWLR